MEDRRKRLHTESVPSVARPSDLPEDVDRAIEVFGNRVRVAILLALLDDGPATVADLTERLQLSRSIVTYHTADLERLGILDVDTPRGQAEVRRRFLRVNRDAVHAAVAAFAIFDR
jgi:DNA-binding transcriptional ArsR family regulator